VGAAVEFFAMSRWRAILWLLFFGAALGCSATGPGPAEPGAERLAERLRDYVYATYEVEDKADDAAIERLRKARAGLADEMEKAGLGVPDKERGLAPLAGRLAKWLAARSDLVFLPLLPDAGGIALVRVGERREEKNYRVLIFDEIVIRPRSPLPGVATVSGKTIYLDRSAARKLAREAVIPKAAVLEGPLPRTGEAQKDWLRLKALAPEIPLGEEALAAAILREEEVRIACLLEAVAAAAPGAEAQEVHRRAVLAAIARGRPRYQIAAAIATILAAQGSPAAEGAKRAIAQLTTQLDLASAEDRDLKDRAASLAK
jgi:hypothetical protein